MYIYIHFLFASIIMWRCLPDMQNRNKENVTDDWSLLWCLNTVKRLALSSRLRNLLHRKLSNQGRQVCMMWSEAALSSSGEKFSPPVLVCLDCLNSCKTLKILLKPCGIFHHLQLSTLQTVIVAQVGATPNTCNKLFFYPHNWDNKYKAWIDRVSQKQVSPLGLLLKI